MLSRLWRGEVSFGAAFWLLGVLLTPLVCWGALRIGPRLALGRSTYPVILAFLIGYGVLVSVAIWRSSARSATQRVWVYGARAAVALAWLVVVGLGGLAIVMFRPDFATTSYTVQAELQPDPELPYIGFWKGNCDENFGLAVQKASADTYFVRFCGPGGCFGKTRFMRTNLVKDPRYKILDQDTLGLRLVPGRQPNLQELDPADRKRVQESMHGDLLLFKRCK
jgi:hypothetical protein